MRNKLIPQEFDLIQKVGDLGESSWFASNKTDEYIRYGKRNVRLFSTQGKCDFI